MRRQTPQHDRITARAPATRYRPWLWRSRNFRPVDNSYERFVGCRFDALESRFKSEVQLEDFRLQAILEIARTLGTRRILDLGCGKGRFAKELAKDGIAVVGTDISRKMLVSSTIADRVRSNVVQLPFASDAFDMVIAIEVIEHIPNYKLQTLIGELRRVVRHDGCILILDKNIASLSSRGWFLPNVLLKRVDEWRGLWMYRGSDPVRERWFWPRAFARRLGKHFGRVEIRYLKSAEEGHALFAWFHSARKFTLWIAREPRGRHA